MISINKPHTGHDDPELTLRWDWNSLLSTSLVCMPWWSLARRPFRGFSADAVSLLLGPVVWQGTSRPNRE
jgi:hypothetical protein